MDDAIVAANADPDQDTILVGPGEISAPTVPADKPVDLIGEGRTVTQLRGGEQSPTPVLRLVDPNSSVSNLQMLIGGGQTAGGLVLEGGSADRIDIRVQSSTTRAFGVDMVDGGALTSSSVLVGSRGTGVSVDADGGQTTSLSDVKVSGAIALRESTSGTGRVVGERLDLSGSVSGIFASGEGGRFNLSSSLVRGRTEGIENRVRGGDHAVALSGVTVSGSNEPGSTGVLSRASNGHTATVDVRDTTITEFPTSLGRFNNVVNDNVPGTANLSVSYSNYSTFDESMGGGSLMQNQGNVDVDPGFVNAPAGDFSLSATSPLIDAGDPSGPFPSESTTDLGRLPRKVDGNGDGGARADIGAFERPAPPAGTGAQAGSSTGGGFAPASQASAAVRDVTAPAVSGASLSRSVFAAGSASTALSAAKKGTDLRYTLSEAATVRIAIQRRVTGARLNRRGKRECAKRTRARRRAARCTRWEAVRTLTRKGSRGRNTVAFTGRVGGRKLTPGRYRFSIVATDRAGNPSAARTVAFRLVR